MTIQKLTVLERTDVQHYIYILDLKKEHYFWLITSGLMVSGRFVSTWKWPIVTVLVNEPRNVNSEAK